MDVRATLRVSPESPGERPSPDRLEKAAADLRETGFQVLRIGRRGVVVSADPERFSEVLGVKPAAASVQAIQPSASRLGTLVDLAEFVSEPKLF